MELHSCEQPCGQRGAAWLPLSRTGRARVAARRRHGHPPAAVVLEPIQGENGVVVPPEGYLRAAREITTAAGALLWLDEVQTGIGRTGTWFAHHADEVTPDIVTSAKGLGGGFPVGACIALGPAGELLQAGMHGTTFGGNPLATGVASAVLDGSREMRSLLVGSSSCPGRSLGTLPLCRNRS